MTLKHLPLLALVLLLTACPRTNPPGVTLTIEPASVTVAAGGVPQEFTATITGGKADEVSWNLAGPGRLSAASGPATLYLPPEDVPATQTVTLRAAAAGVSASATITLTPVSGMTGNLSIYLEGLSEPGAAGEVAVSGPDGFTAELAASRTLLNLPPGSYTVSARNVRVRQGTLEALRRPELECEPQEAAAVDSCTVMVEPGATARVRATYRLEPASGRLYLPGYFTDTTGAYSASQLAESSSSPPAVLFQGTPSAQGLAFDAAGNLWASDWDGNTLSRYLPSQLAGSGTPTSEITIRSGLYNPTGLAVHPDGSLWVTNRGNSSVVRFDPGQLEAPGPATPAVTLTDDGGGQLSGPTGVAFDAHGRLWFANAFSGTLFRYDAPDRLTGAISTPPDAVFSSAGLSFPLGLAFDTDGSLWVSDGALNTVVKFTPEQLEVSGTPLPAVTISDLAAPGGLAFDAAGSLWVANSGSTVVAFAPEQLTAPGSPDPRVVLSGFESINLGFLAFYPPPRGLPLVQGQAAFK